MYTVRTFILSRTTEYKGCSYSKIFHTYKPTLVTLTVDTVGISLYDAKTSCKRDIAIVVLCRPKVKAFITKYFGRNYFYKLDFIVNIYKHQLDTNLY